MNEVSKLIKKKSGQSVTDFVNENLTQKYHAYIASLVTGTMRIRDVKTIMDKIGIDANTFFSAYEKSYRGPKEVPKFTPMPKKVNNPFKYGFQCFSCTILKTYLRMR
jgi:hypothetical protein